MAILRSVRDNPSTSGVAAELLDRVLSLVKCGSHALLKISEVGESAGNICKSNVDYREPDAKV